MCRDVCTPPRTNVCEQALTLPPASDPNYKKYEPWLSAGWVPGRKIVGGIGAADDTQKLTASRIFPMPNIRAFEETCHISPSSLPSIHFCEKCTMHYGPYLFEAIPQNRMGNPHTSLRQKGTTDWSNGRHSTLGGHSYSWRHCTAFPP